MLFCGIYTLNNQMLVFNYTQNCASLTFIFACNNHYFITFLNFRHFLSPIHKTSGANETIFINFTVRNSLVTGPNIRVPIGSNLLFNNTAALSSNLSNEPSLRRTPLVVRTTTALYTSPFLTLPLGAASLMLTFIISPMPAYCLFDPPSTLMHIRDRAPVLSATLSLDCICIIDLFSFIDLLSANSSRGY